MAKEDLVASLKNGKENKDKSVSVNEDTQISLFHFDDKSFKKKVKNSNVDMKCQDVQDYVKSLVMPIQLVVTSPPYNCNIKYDVHNDNLPWDQYKNWLIDVFKSIHAKIVTGGRVVLNFPIFVKDEDKRISLTGIFEDILKAAGFDIIDYIIWVKAKSEEEAIGAAGRSTAWGSWLSPSSPNVRPISELILIAKKPGRFEVDRERIDISVDEFKKFTISTWFMQSAGSNYHPATFPDELPFRAIKLYSHKGDNILDPFMGVGSTAIGCVRSERNFYGCDISQEYLKVAVARISNL